MQLSSGEELILNNITAIYWACAGFKKQINPVFRVQTFPNGLVQPGLLDLGRIASCQMQSLA